LRQRSGSGSAAMAAAVAAAAAAQQHWRWHWQRSHCCAAAAITACAAAECAVATAVVSVENVSIFLQRMIGKGVFVHVFYLLPFLSGKGVFLSFWAPKRMHSKKDCSNRNLQFEIWRDLFFTTRQTVFFFRALARKTKNKNSSLGTGAIRWASAALALSSACGPSTPVPINGAR
jgi:hypothetical protein